MQIILYEVQLYVKNSVIQEYILNILHVPLCTFKLLCTRIQPPEYIQYLPISPVHSLSITLSLTHRQYFYHSRLHFNSLSGTHSSISFSHQHSFSLALSLSLALSHSLARSLAHQHSLSLTLSLQLTLSLSLPTNLLRSNSMQFEIYVKNKRIQYVPLSC